MQITEAKLILIFLSDVGFDFKYWRKHISKVHITVSNLTDL